jgi:hypothetical protein
MTAKNGKSTQKRPYREWMPRLRASAGSGQRKCVRELGRAKLFTGAPVIAPRGMASAVQAEWNHGTTVSVRRWWFFYVVF